MQDGRCRVFVIVNHASGEVWFDAAGRMDRFAAADLLREVCAQRFGSVEAAVAAGLARRYDGGSCFRSEHYRTEIDHLGISRSPVFHYEPETNGCVEKAIQTLKEQVLWSSGSRRSSTCAPPCARSVAPTTPSGSSSAHSFRSPIEAREHLIRQAAMA